MNWLRNSIWIVGFLALTIRCSEDDNIFHGPYHVRFTESSDFKKESYTDTISIEVHLAGPALDNQVIVNYDISGTARQDVDYVILDNPGQLMIPAGDYFGFIRIKLINNANNILRSQNIVFTLKTVIGGSLEIGQGSSAIGRSFTFTIFDDCILGGTYDEYTLNYRIRDLQVASPDCETYTVSNLYLIVGPDLFVINLDFVDNNDNTLTVPEQNPDGLPSDADQVTGSGIINPTTREITVELTLEEFEDKPTVSFALRPV